MDVCRTDGGVSLSLLLLT